MLFFFICVNVSAVRWFVNFLGHGERGVGHKLIMVLDMLRVKTRVLGVQRVWLTRFDERWYADFYYSLPDGSMGIYTGTDKEESHTYNGSH